MTRQEAIKELEKISWSDRGMEAIYMAIDVLQQEPKRGKWVDKGDFYVCSECGRRMPYAVLGPEFARAYAFMSDYCPHCGSPMEVESDEE